MIKLVYVLFLVGSLGCASNKNLSITAQDQLNAANVLVSNFLDDPRATKVLAGKKKVIGVSKIVNQTTQLVYSNILTDNVIQALRESGICDATATFNYNEVENDPLVLKLRKLRTSEEVDQSTVAQKNSLKAPDMTLTGTITEDTVRNGRKVEKAIVTNLKVVDVSTGLIIWSGQHPIFKTGKRGARTW